MGRAMA
jgi:hypothetical protein